MASIVIALGGNAILQPEQLGTFEEQLNNVGRTCGQIARLALQGHRIIVTHGNAPQVENILLQNEEAYKAASIPLMPLDACGAESQGLIGYILQRSLHNELCKTGAHYPVVSLITQVVVDEGDPAFANPSKPVGPFYTKARAEKLAAQRGHIMQEDSNRGYRRVVPSPQPRAIVEEPVIRSLWTSGCIVIASGGGGIPVLREPSGEYRGIEAVIDRDLASQRLASDLGADYLLMLTDVDHAALNFGRPNQQSIECATAKQVADWYKEGHFRPGSMGPKVTAAIRFVTEGGKEAIITSVDKALEALSGAGTHIVP